MKGAVVLAGALAVLAVPALAAPPQSAPSSLTYQEAVARGAPLAVTVTTRRAAAFRVLLRVRTEGRTQLFLLGRHAPKGGPLIDTKTHYCEGAAGSYYCKASYEPLPAGTFTWRIVRVSGAREVVTLTVKW